MFAEIIYIVWIEIDKLVNSEIGSEVSGSKNVIVIDKKKNTKNSIPALFNVNGPVDSFFLLFFCLIVFTVQINYYGAPPPPPMVIVSDPNSGSKTKNIKVCI
jgi:hypothetical protein